MVQLPLQWFKAMIAIELRNVKYKIFRKECCNTDIFLDRRPFHYYNTGTGALHSLTRNLYLLLEELPMNITVIYASGRKTRSSTYQIAQMLIKELLEDGTCFSFFLPDRFFRQNLRVLHKYTDCPRSDHNLFLIL